MRRTYQGIALACVGVALACAWPPAVAAADNDKGLAGTWAGTSGANNLKETWTIRQANDQWTVTGTFKKNNQEVGSFHGQDAKVAGGVLTFRQVYDKKPVASWSDGNEFSVTAAGDKLSFTWTNGGQSGKGTLDRATPAPALVGVWAGTSGADGLQEIWAIQQQQGQWVVNGVFRRNGIMVGSFVGRNVKEDNGTLTFTQAYVRKPVLSWADGTQMTATADGNDLNFTWKNANGQTGTVTMTRAK